MSLEDLYSSKYPIRFYMAFVYTKINLFQISENIILDLVYELIMQVAQLDKNI